MAAAESHVETIVKATNWRDLSSPIVDHDVRIRQLEEEVAQYKKARVTAGTALAVWAFMQIMALIGVDLRGVLSI